MKEDEQKQSKIGMIALIFALIALSVGATVIPSDFYLNTMNGSVTLLPGSNVTIVDDTENKTITINLIGDGISDHGSLVGLLDNDHPQYASLTYVNSSDDLKINKSNIGEASGGTLSDSRLSTNVPLLDKTNNFTSGVYFSGDVGIKRIAPLMPLSVFGTLFDAPAGGEYYKGNLNFNDLWAIRLSATAGAGDFNLDANYGAGYTPKLTILRANGNVGIGTTNPAQKLDVAGNVYVSGDVSALTFTDRTPYYDGDALHEISKISGKNGSINHSTLPDFVSHGNESRDIGAMVSVLTKAIQELNQKNIQLEKKIIDLESKCIN